MFSVVTDFDKLRVERFKQATEEKLRDIRCPEHRQPPRLPRIFAARYHHFAERLLLSRNGDSQRQDQLALGG
jgi:hypothetical protein